MHHYKALVCFTGYLLHKPTDNIPQLPSHPFPFTQTRLVSVGLRSVGLFRVVLLVWLLSELSGKHKS